MVTLFWGSIQPYGPDYLASFKKSATWAWLQCAQAYRSYTAVVQPISAQQTVNTYLHDYLLKNTKSKYAPYNHTAELKNLFEEHGTVDNLYKVIAECNGLVATEDSAVKRYLKSWHTFLNHSDPLEIAAARSACTLNFNMLAAQKYCLDQAVHNSIKFAAQGSHQRIAHNKKSAQQKAALERHVQAQQKAERLNDRCPVCLDSLLSTVPPKEICVNGHYLCQNCYDAYNDSLDKCPICRAGSIKTAKNS